MRDLLKIVKNAGLCAALALAFALMALDGARAANPLELNFWLSGPRYDGRVAPGSANPVGDLCIPQHDAIS